TGALLLSLGLGVLDSAIAVIIGGALAAVVLGLLSIVGPRTGATQVMGSRAVFGVRGAGIGALLTLFLAIGWFPGDSGTGREAVMGLLSKAGVDSSRGLQAVVLLVIVAASVLVAVYGHQTISVFERFGAVVFVAFSLLVFLWLTPKLHFDAGSSLSG